MCIRGCQISSFSNTEDLLNILTGRLSENEQDGEPVILGDDEIFSSECLTDEEWKHLLQKCTSSLTQSSASGPWALDSVSASTFLEKKAEAAINSENYKTETTLQVTLNGTCNLGGTSGQILHML